MTKDIELRIKASGNTDIDDLLKLLRSAWLDDGGVQTTITVGPKVRLIELTWVKGRDADA